MQRVYEKRDPLSLWIETILQNAQIGNDTSIDASFVPFVVPIRALLLSS